MPFEALGDPLNIGIAAASVIAGFGLVQVARAKRNQLPLPPGPKGFPLIGNLLDIPKDKPWKVYNEWAKQYGDVIFFRALGHNFVVLNSLEAANELLSSRAANYSNRPESPIIDLTEVTWGVSFKNYGPEWRQHRQVLHRFFNQTAVPKFRFVIEEEVSRLLNSLLSTPQLYREIVKDFFALTLMRISYGSNDIEYNRQLAHQGDIFTYAFMDALKPGQLLVGVMPSLRYVPSWFPGAGWKRTLRNIADLGYKLNREPFFEAKRNIDAGLQSDQGVDIVTRLIAELPAPDTPEYQDKEKTAMHVTSQAYLAGIDTTNGSVLALIYALAANQDVQRKAQDELDRVIGTNRLPNFNDLDHLQYVQALVKEVGRWHSVVPLSVPHVSVHEDEYKGYRIPAKTMILTNTWAIMNDPDRFEDPEAFKPERYLKDGKLNPEVLDPEVAAFGYGRRICPGRYLSNEILTMMAASVLACFNIKPPKDAQGQEIPMSPMDMDSVVIVTPLPFDCSIEARSEQHAQLILNIMPEVM